MNLFLDSVDFKEIENAFEWGFIKGLTTTPTFMHRHGITDIDSAIVKLSKLVPELHVEALGENCDEILNEAERILSLPLEKPPVFKIPISNYSVKACKKLTDKGYKVNIHLVYTLNQAYLAMEAGATYICPLVGRLHDQGHDAMKLIEDTVKAVNYYKYPTKIMVSSIRNPEHIRQSILRGAHACTVPYNILIKLNNNALTTIGTNQFFEHTKLMTVKVRNVIRKHNPVCTLKNTIWDALMQMTKSKLGAVSIVDEDGKLIGIFTDGDLRRQLRENKKEVLEYKMSNFKYSKSTTIRADALLYEVVNLFSKYEYDNIIVEENDKPIGILDIQDLVKLGLIG